MAEWRRAVSVEHTGEGAVGGACHDAGQVQWVVQSKTARVCAEGKFISTEPDLHRESSAQASATARRAARCSTCSRLGPAGVQCACACACALVRYLACRGCGRRRTSETSFSRNGNAGHQWGNPAESVALCRLSPFPHSVLVVFAAARSLHHDRVA